MKKGIAAITAVVVLMGTGLTFAQMDDKGKEMMKDKAVMMDAKGGMMGMMEGKDMMGMCHSMMNKPSLVGVSDGVVVLSGKKLYKYDSNLNLVKEAEIKIEAMEDGKMCPMCQMMKDKDLTKDDSKKTNPNTPAVDHAAHH